MVAALAGFHVWYTFDGPSPLVARTAAGGALRTEPHGGGLAIRFPPRCRGDACPRAILESPLLDELNPGTRPLSFGAAVKMAPTDTADGANIVQKGYSVGGVTQYKLQVDGRAGNPSCVLASKTQIYRIVAPVRVADGRWHRLDCRRTGPMLAVHVDGLPRAILLVPADLSIVNTVPLRIGGKSVKPDNDQYAGALDDVYIAIQ